MDEINKLQGQILEHKAYLYETDWVVSRFAETDEGIPEGIKMKRAECRVKIDELRAQIKVLEAELLSEENVKL